MQNNKNDADRAVATRLNGVNVRGERNLLAETAAPGIEGARAALETFYYAFNTRSPDLYQQIWADDPLVQLDTPVAGNVRGHAAIAALVARMVLAPARVRVQSVFEDIVAYATPELVVFSGRERGSYTSGDSDSDSDSHSGSERESTAGLSEIRTTCICVFRFIAEQGGWRQVYHLVSLDDADQLARYQRAVRGA